MPVISPTPAPLIAAPAPAPETYEAAFEQAVETGYAQAPASWGDVWTAEQTAQAWEIFAAALGL